jgi:hypothetical protein
MVSDSLTLLNRAKVFAFAAVSAAVIFEFGFLSVTAD